MGGVELAAVGLVGLAWWEVVLDLPFPLVVVVVVVVVVVEVEGAK